MHGTNSRGPWTVLLIVASMICSPELLAAAPNLLYITVDDMSCDSVGAFGCKLPDTTPNVDRLASEGLRFEHAYVVVGNCMPSRNVMYSGLYPHNNGVEGFRQNREAKWPHLVDLFQSAGYFTAIRHKVSHSSPYSPYGWDMVLDETQQRPHVKNVQTYYDSVKIGIESSRTAGKPFCLVINIADPHKPFYGMGGGDRFIDDPHVPTRVFSPDEVPIPGFLFDHPDVCRELAHYYSSVRRADDCVGAALTALDESGQADKTVVVFLSDHGMPLPFAKTALYYHSTHTPLIVRWPGVTKPGSVDAEHMVSAVDMLSTLCGIAGITPPERQDGRSFLPLLKGETQDHRDIVYTEYNENSGGIRQPMRSVMTKRFGYIFNPWSNGERLVRTATQGTIAYRTMKKVAPENIDVAERLKLFEHRVVEEFYDYAADPDALVNLIDDPRYLNELNELRGRLEAHMAETGDPALEAFRHRKDREFLAKFMAQQEAEAAAVQKAGGRRRGEAQEGDDEPENAPPPRQRRDLLSLDIPEVIPAGHPVSITIRHALPNELGEQSLHVTLKQGTAETRVDRQVVKASGTGSVEVTFDIPASVTDGKVSFAVFVGKDFPSSLQRITTKPVAVQ